MFGLLGGIAVGFSLAKFGEISCWWTLLTALLGIVIEVAIRLGLGELLAAVCDILGCIGSD